jgi:hypothetical protein
MPSLASRRIRLRVESGITADSDGFGRRFRLTLISALVLEVISFGFRLTRAALLARSVPAEALATVG